MTLRVAASWTILLLANAVVAQESPPSPPALPTAQELTSQVDAGDYRGALKGLIRVLDLKGPAAAGYDRCKMLMLKVECQLQIRENKAALDTLELARKEAVDSRNSDGLFAALALADLISHSPNLKFVSKNKTGPLNKPIDILDRKQRPEAYKALFDEELPAAKSKLLDVATTQNISTIFDAAKALALLKGLEKSGIGHLDESKKLSDDLSVHALRALQGWNADFGGRIDVISVQAHTIVTLPVARYDASGKLIPVTKLNGLQTADVQNLKGIQQSCGQIITAAGDLMLALQDATADDAYHSVADIAASLQVKAEQVLGENYQVIPR